MNKQVSLYPETKTQELPEGQKKKLLELCREIKKLAGGSAACSDALDSLGFMRSAMDPCIAPYFPSKGRACGIAYTIRGANITGLPKGTEEVRETVDLDYYTNIKDGYFLCYGTNCAERGTIIGDVTMTFASSRGAVGAVIDGPIRDLERLESLDLLTFGPSAAPPSGEGRVLWIEYNCIVQVGGVWVEPWDIIFGDRDGVVVIPKHLAAEVYKRAKEIGDKEEEIKKDFLKHRDKGLLEIFAMHGRRP